MATSKSLLAPLKEALTSGVILPLSLSLCSSIQMQGVLSHVQAAPGAVTKRFSKLEEFPLIFYHHMQNKAVRPVRGPRCCRGEEIRQMECFCSHPVLHGASGAQVSFIWP